jgi:hypothetical protein
MSTVNQKTGGVPGGTYDDGVAGALDMRYGMPPFSILDARQDKWQSRKRAWIERIGISSGLGRLDGLTYDSALGARAGRGLKDAPTTSVFDPYLCELAYRWYTRRGDAVLDPFSGGSVRGLVAAWLGRDYVGVDLSSEQILENTGQRDKLDLAGTATWIVGDSRAVLPYPLGAAAPREQFDYVFSCPPYFDLEQYSSDPLDLSNMAWHQFGAAYEEIIAAAIARLEQDRFAGWVVGDIRDQSTGLVRPFVEQTIECFEGAGAALYDKAVLVSPIGTMPIRANNQFRASRKLVRGHQYLLVFCKGDPKAATQRMGDVEAMAELPQLAPGNDQLALI